MRDDLDQSADYLNGDITLSFAIPERVLTPDEIAFLVAVPRSRLLRWLMWLWRVVRRRR